MNIKEKIMNLDGKGKRKLALKIVLSIAILFVFLILFMTISYTVSDYEVLEEEYNLLYDENKELKAKLEKAEPWFKMKEEEQKAIEEENAKKEAEEEAKRKAEEEEAERLAEEEEKKGYDTGIRYKDLARNPENYVGKKIKFQGKVAQVMEGDGEVQIRLAVGGSYDDIIYCVYDSSIVSSRVLEGDYITVMGVSTDLLTYTSTMGGEITIPSMLVEKIDM